MRSSHEASSGRLSTSFLASSGAAAPVLGELLGNDTQPAVAYLEEVAGRRALLPSREAGEVLARALQPREDDTERVKLLRNIVFDWVWKAAQPGD